MKMTTIMKRLGSFKSVENYDGKPNQFFLEFEHGEVLQSYQSIIAIKLHSDSCRFYLGSNWDYSKTAGRYRNMFTGYNKADTERKINAGLYIVLGN